MGEVTSKSIEEKEKNGAFTAADCKPGYTYKIDSFDGR
jgi:hypothetical protein